MLSLFDKEKVSISQKTPLVLLQNILMNLIQTYISIFIQPVI